MQVFWRLTYGTKVSPDSRRPQDQPSEDDKQGSPKVPGVVLSWRGELTPISVQAIDQPPDGSHSDPPEQETGSQDDDALLEVRISTPPEDTSLIMVPDRVAPEHISTIIQLRRGM